MKEGDFSYCTFCKKIHKDPCNTRECLKAAREETINTTDRVLRRVTPRGMPAVRSEESR